MGLLGDPHGTHASLADRFQQLVAAGDDVARLHVGSIGSGPLRAARHRPVQQVPGPLVRPQERLDMGPESGVASASLIDVGGPLFGVRQRHSGSEDGLGTFGRGGHGLILVCWFVSLR